MNCYYHSNCNAVAQCTGCHKGLCQQCATKFAIPICVNVTTKGEWVSG